jgi:hypothetical protein
LRAVDPLHVTGVICGWRVGEGEVVLLRDDLKRENPNLRLMFAILDGGKVNLG